MSRALSWAWQRVCTWAAWMVRPRFAQAEIIPLVVTAWLWGAHPRWVIAQVLLLAMWMTGGRFLRHRRAEGTPS